VFARVDRNEAAGFSLRENQPSELKKFCGILHYRRVVVESKQTRF
jgi:hypothetical protein